MANESIATYLKYANLQMAAEAFLCDDNGKIFTDDLFIKALVAGNNHASKFPDALATEFASQWEVVAHQPNTDSGFSGTLFRATKTIESQGITKGDLVMSFRSTEFIDDALRDSAGTNAHIASNGWAFGQIADMEKWYQQLQNDGVLTPSSTFDITGYSLGGHLATAFAMLRSEQEQSPIKHIYTFNGGGTGGIENGNTLTGIMSTFNRVLAGEEPPETSQSYNGIMTVGEYLMTRAQADLDAYNQECIRVTGKNMYGEEVGVALLSNGRSDATTNTSPGVMGTVYFTLLGYVNCSPEFPKFPDFTGLGFAYTVP